MDLQCSIRIQAADPQPMHDVTLEAHSNYRTDFSRRVTRVLQRESVNYGAVNITELLWPPYRIGQAIIFLPYSFFLLSFFFILFSSPNLSGRRLDVCHSNHTSTHDVALVRIWNAGLKCAARCSLKIQDAKNRHGHHRTICWAISSQRRHVLTIGKKTC